MIEIGRLVTKIAGRDAGCKGIIIDILDDKYVLIDGETRRRRCNILHLEPLNQVLKIEKGATHGDVDRALKELGVDARTSKPRPKTTRLRRKRKTPEQLRAQKEEKRKLRDLFRPKKKEEKAESKEATLEEKAGLVEEKREEVKESVESDLKIAPLEEKEAIKKAKGKKMIRKKEE